MDSSLYKDKVTPRGFKYHYFFSAATADKPTLLFLHGFPSTSYDWHHQAKFFTAQGYGVLIPDLLGYGGTDKPIDAASYKKKDMAADVISLLEEENISNVFAIGHDWGSGLNSALAIRHADKFKGFGFLALGYIPPTPKFDVESFLQMQKSLLGYEPYAYWLFFTEDGTDKILEEKIDSLVSLLHPNDSKVWLTHMCPRGATKSWITQGKTLPERASYLTEEDEQTIKANLVKGGLAGPLNWYKAVVHGHNNKDDEAIPPQNYVVHKPVFIGAALQDPVCTAAAARFIAEKTCPNVEIKEYDAGHWIPLAVPDKVNADLLEWVQKHASE